MSSPFGKSQPQAPFAAAPPTDLVTLAQLLGWRATAHPDHTAYVFLERGVEVGRLSYASLFERARAVAARLQAQKAEGKRALLLYPSGEAYVVAFWGCLLAGVVAVPAYPPHNQRTLRRLLAIAQDCEPALVLTTGELALPLRARLIAHPSLWALKWLATDKVPASEASRWKPGGACPDDLAFLQYTSGSTAAPKGVMVSHANLMHNAAMIQTAFELTPASVAVCWVPLYHDLGLIGHMLQAVHGGFTCVIMSPLDFLAEPRLWLEAIDRYGGTHAGAPNFAFDLCVRKMPSEDRARLDLSRWVLASNCAEPVRADTLERFSEAFAPAGFRPTAFRPTYGLAEVTLLGTIDALHAAPRVMALDKAALGAHRAEPARDAEAVHAVSCGRAWADMRVAIVDPDTHQERSPGAVGEIWLAAANVARGYWNRPEATAETFGARLAGSDEGPFLRTGDLGFVADGELFVTGRLKDMLILRGANLYPQDLERSIEAAHARLRPGCSAAFALEVDGEERLGVIAEAARGCEPAEAEEAIAAIRRALAEDHGLTPHAVAIWPAGTIPKTSSGKIQRRACRDAFARPAVKALARWVVSDAEWRAAHEAPEPEAVLEAVVPAAPDASGFERLVAEVWAEVLGREAVDPDANFFDLGGSSLLAVRAATRLRERTGVALPLTELFKHPTVRAIARRLADGAPAGMGAPFMSGEPQALSGASGDVAIVGMALRVPGAKDLDTFWAHLMAGVEARRTFSDAELRAAGVSDALLADPRYVKAGAVLDDQDRFDAPFFGYTPREAELLDPQQRLFLEVAHAALEHAGCAPGAGPLPVGVFAGAGANQYFALHLASRPGLVAGMDDFALALASDKDYVATRVAYALDLRGPALTVQTACSTSLVAVHLACKSLLAGECRAALAGGSAVNVRQLQGYLHVEGGVRSPDGRCRAFDAQAQGTPFTSGAGAVVLKRLEDALADGDTIHAVIKGSAINNDGAGKVGFTAPSVEGQARAIAEAIAASGVDAGSISYVEAHGTGTALGDPIEVAALTEAYRVFTDAVGTTALGSVKSNLGHLDAAAGVVGLIKAALTVKHGQIPPTLNVEAPSPHIDFASSPFVLATSLRTWPQSEGPRRAGVSAFGLGGTNAHVVLESHDAPRPPAALPRPELLVLSAKTPAALEEATAALKAHLERHRDTLSLADVAHTLQQGRAAFRHRRMLVAGSVDEAIALLGSLDPSRVLDAEVGAGAPAPVFLVPGQGAQHPGMGRGLYETEPVFREAIDRCAELLAPHLGADLRDLLYGESADAGALYRPALAQPALFAVAYASAALWLASGLAPRAMIGHSLGEYVVATLAGTCTLEEALGLVAERGRLFEAVGGAMLSVSLPEADVAPYLAPGLAIAATNGPAFTAVAGDEAAITALQARLEADGVTCRRPSLPHAAHCGPVEPMMAPLAEAADRVAWQPPGRPYLSNLTGNWATAPDGAYWAAHLRAPVRFAQGLARALEAPDALLVELGPGQTLGTFARSHPARGDRPVLFAMRHAQEPVHDRAAFLAALGRAWLAGASVDWNRPQDRPARRVPLPTYPFARHRYWIDPPGPTALVPLEDRASTLLETAPIRRSEGPLTPDETRLVALFEELLGVRPVGRHASFFELGGHSLLGTQAIARIRRLFGVELTLADLFATPTVAGLARRLGEAAPARDHAIPSAPRDGALPLSYAQERLWFLEQLAPGPRYNLPHAARLEGPLDVAALRAALHEVIRRHEALRTVFPAEGGRAVQRVLPAEAIAPVALVDLSGLPAEEREDEAARLAAEEAHQPFDLATGPLVRMTLYRLGPDRHWLLLAMHHIVADGWSMGVLLRELAELYTAQREGRAPALAPLAVQYVDYAVWQRAQDYAPQLAYWRDRLAGPLPRLGLPADHPEAPAAGRGARLSRRLPEGMARAVASWVQAHGATPFMGYFAAYMVLLHGLTGREDVLVSVPVANRPDADSEALVGFFVNSLAMRTDLAGDPSAAELLARVKATALGAFAHQDVPLQQVVDAVRPERDAGGLSLIEASFALQNAPMPALALGEVALSPLAIETRTAKVDLLLDLTPGPDGLELAMEYDADRFEAATIRRWLDAYERVLAAIAAAPQARLSELAAPVAQAPAPSSREALYARTNLTENQLLVWLGHQRHADVPLYTIATAAELGPDLDVAAFQQAFDRVVAAADALRTVVTEPQGVPMQQVLPTVPFTLPVVEVADEPALEAAMAARQAAPFRPEERLFDAALYRRADGRWVLYMALHHLVGDGGALAAIHRQVRALYARLRRGEAVPPPALPSFAAHVRAERARRGTPDHARTQAFWQAVLATPADPVSFFGRSSARGGTRVHREAIDLGPERTARLRAAAAGPMGGFSAFATVLLALMHRHGGGRTLTLGTPLHHRATAAERDTVGLLMELVPLRLTLEPAASLATLRDQVTEAAVAAIAHGHAAIANPDGDRAYDVCLNYLDHAAFGSDAPVRWLHGGHELDTLFVQVHDHGPARSLTLDVDFHEAVFEAPDRAAFMRQLLAVLDGWLADPACPVADAPWLSPEDEALLARFDAPAVPYPPEATVLTLFEAQVRGRPAAVAVRAGEATLTYAELNAAADFLAARLRAVGVGPDQRVGVCVDRSVHLVVALLGVLKAGGAYVPLDPDYPGDRLAFMLEDAAPAAIVTQRALQGRLPAFAGPIVLADDNNPASPADNIPSSVAGNNLAYVLYTSGSSGRPKGVCVGHAQLANAALAWRDAYGLDADHVHLQLASVSFDVATGDWVRALCFGARLVIAPAEARLDPPALLALMAAEGVTTAELVPSVLRALVAHMAATGRTLPAMRLLVAGSEPWAMGELARTRAVFGPATRVVSSYGLTEATIDSTWFEATAHALPDDAPVPLGRPFANTRLRVVDAAGRPVPVGVPGEILVGGAGVALGYWNRPALTAERFLDGPDGRWYRTGDWGRYLPDGTLATLGRRDQQVKVRGQRIELGELEAVLRAHPDVAEAAVAAPEGRLVAWVAPTLADDGVRATLEAERVAAWSRIYDEDAAASANVADPTFDVTGWTSSFTGAPIPAAEMRAWRDATLDRIRALRPRRMLEIGAGSGLLLFPLAPELEAYHGTDFSAPSLARLTPHVGSWPHVSLDAREADRFEGLTPGAFDTVVLNSVVQYFPGGAYLRRVLKGALATAGPAGAVFVGDVRHLGLLEAFQAAVAAQRGGTDLATAIDRAVALEQELLIDPALFETLPGVGRVEVQLKRGTDANEMTAFRYDVTLHPGATGDRTVPPCLDWAGDRLTLAALAERLADGPQALAVGGVPNARVASALSALHRAGRGPVPDAGAIDPESLYGLAEAAGYHAEVRFDPRHPGRVVALFTRPEATARTAFPAARPAGPLTNDPLRAARERSLEAALRAHLEARLPDGWVPGRIIWVSALPTLPNGKLDRNALVVPDAPSAQAHEAPETEAERTLAAIWAEVLGVASIGRRDNFFALGGDSILSIQVIAKAAERGLKLTPRLLFEHQTLADLAAAAGTGAQAAAGPTGGPAPLTPIQRWFFSQDLPTPHHYNQSLLLRPEAPIAAERLERAIAALVAHHPMLRASFVPGPDGWTQTLRDTASPPALPVYDLAPMPVAAQDAALEAIGAGLQASLDLAEGPLLRAAVFRLGQRGDRLLLVAHHLVVDGVSWRVLLADLALAYAEPERPLPPASTPFRTWAERLAAWAPTVADERAYWAAQPWQEAAPLPVDMPDGTNLAGAQRTLSVTLDAETTRRLLSEAPRAYRTRADEALLAALAIALRGLTGADRHAVMLEGHGREPIADDLDLSRTVGWFTTLFPVLLDAAAGAPGPALVAAKEALRAVPRHGLGYGLLQPDGPRPAIAFNYLGRFGAELDGRSGFTLADEAAGPVHGPAHARPVELSVDAMEVAGTLRLHWTYAATRHHEATVRALAEAHLAALRAIVDHAAAPGTGAHTPSDFPLARLSAPTLARLVGESRPAAPTIEDIVPLTPMQQGMLFHSLLAPGSGDYVVQAAIELVGTLDEVRFEAAWRETVARHPILRTSFHWEGLPAPVQVVHAQVPLPFERLDWQHLDAPAQAGRLAAHLAEDRARGFEPGTAPLMRMAVACLGPDRWRFLWSAHHGLLDGWSSALLVQEVFARYADHPLPPAPRPFRDHVAWLAGQDVTAAEAFWRRALAGVEAPTPLGLDRPTGATGRATAEAVLGPEAVRALVALGRARQWTLNTLVAGAWAVLTSRLAGEASVVFGAVSAGRPPEVPGTQAMVGPFLVTHPVRALVEGDRPLADWLSALQAWLVEARAHEHLALPAIHALSAVPRRLPLFESLLVFENYPVDPAVGQALPRLRAGALETRDQTNYPLTLTVLPGDTLTLRADTDASRLDAEAARRLVALLAALLEALPAAVSGPVADWPWLSGGEARAIEALDADTPVTVPDTTIHALFEAQARERPQALAVRSGESALTYAELNASADALAARLKGLGVGRDRRVGLCVDRSVEMLVALLGVLKAGGAYVPLDPDYPADRLAFMVEDAELTALVTQPALESRLPAFDGPVLPVTDASSASPAPIAEPVAGTDLAYVLYTSGSTGTPKGVCVEHRQVVNFLTHFQRTGLVGPSDRLLAVTTLSFDIAVLELLLPLTVGATVLLATRDEARDPQALAARLSEATVMQATPATWRALVEGGWAGAPGLRMLSGGEALPRDLADALLPRGAALWNLYGPTETTIWSTATPVAAEGPIHVGRPIANTQLRVVDAALRPVPLGAPGELLIGGAGVARGYWNRPALSAERFVDGPGGRWYRTGDRARRRPDGTVEVLGRLDDQVKLHGHRLELGEVESALRAHPAVADAAVALREDRPGDRRLVAYVVARAAAPDPTALRRFLESRLPAAVVPSRVVALAELPRTPNGKLDRKALPAPPDARPATMAPFEPPVGELETAIAEVLTAVLGLDRVGALDNFFDLGGSSLLAMQALGQLRTRLEREIPLVAIFEHPNARALAAHLAGSGPAASATGVDRGEARKEAADARTRRMAARRAHREGDPDA